MLFIYCSATDDDDDDKSLLFKYINIAYLYLLSE